MSWQPPCYNSFVVIVDQKNYFDHKIIDCDDNNDGFTTLIMDTFDSVASQGVPASNVKYFLTEEDAINNENILPDYVYNTSNPQLIYIRVTNVQTTCYDISTLEVSLNLTPIVGACI